MTIAADRERQPLEIARRSQKAELALQEYQQRLAAMTPDELEAARSAEATLNRSLQQFPLS